MATTVRVAVAGGTGYSGIELLRILHRHPAVEIVRVTSEQYAGKNLRDVYGSFRSTRDLILEPLDAETIGAGVDAVFSALPHGAAATTVANALRSGARSIDLSADFRLRDAAVFRRWYGDHPVPELLADAVYGLPEFSRERIRCSRLVAVPGCYPTGALLALVPLARRGIVGDGAVVIDAKSGASGAGRSAKTDLLFCEIDENVRAYAVGSHRHQPEIAQEFHAAGGRSAIVFTPHILPIRRGILSTIYVPLAKRAEDVEEAFRGAYASEPFVHVLGADAFPEVRDVRGTNEAQIGWKVLADQQLAIVVTAIDNLGKGAAGQAVQSFNVMFDLEETTGLLGLAAVP
jgi:N-acetyl-gamma-glutamyl-phosphate reductase